MTKTELDSERIHTLEKENHILTTAMRQSNLIQKRLQNALNQLQQKDRQLKTTQEKLQANLLQLQQMQKQMLEREKMVALGSLVAGVAHEVNTPLGVAITSISMISESTKKLRHSFDKDELSEEELIEFLDTSDETINILQQNLDRAAKLIRSFKMISVDQNINDLRTVKIKQYIQDIIIPFHNQLKKFPVEIKIDCPDDLLIELYPGPFAQLISNLLQNAIIHAFEAGKKGLLEFKVSQQNSGLSIIVTDNGKGMSHEIQQHAFEPFITTRRNQGGSGLGLNIVYNIVTQNFGGTIELESKLNFGTRFIIFLNLTLKE